MFSKTLLDFEEARLCNTTFIINYNYYDYYCYYYYYRYLLCHSHMRQIDICNGNELTVITTFFDI